MSWSISITPEGWGKIYEAIHEWSKEDLIYAIVDDYYESLAEQGKGPETCVHRSMKKKYFYEAYASQEALADLAFSLIEKNNTCDNGGNGFYIDREGYHQVFLPE